MSNESPECGKERDRGEIRADKADKVDMQIVFVVMQIKRQI